MTIIIHNFNLDPNNWMLVSDLGAFNVDAIDTTHGISTSGSYFLHNGQQVTTTFSGITDGYRMFYTPSGVVSSGTFTITARARNNNNDTEEETYYLLYGYNLLFDEQIEWPPHYQVDVLVQASNEAFCPNTEGEGFNFTTIDLESRDLGATLIAVEAVDLGATIYPQSTAFFYGKTYTVTVSGVRDFSGNIMDPFVLTFTIEDPTE